MDDNIQVESKMTEKDEADFKQAMDAMYEYELGILKKNNLAKRLVKRLINYKFAMISDQMEDLEKWEHEGFIEVELSDHKNGCYPHHLFYTEKGNKASVHYMRCDDNGEFHYMVFQVNPYEDSYSGYLLFPLNDGRHWKISYSC